MRLVPCRPSAIRSRRMRSSLVFSVPLPFRPMPGTDATMQTARRRRLHVGSVYDTSVPNRHRAAGFRPNCAFVDCRTVPDVRYRGQLGFGVCRARCAATVTADRRRTRIGTDPHCRLRPRRSQRREGQVRQQTEESLRRFPADYPLPRDLRRLPSPHRGMRATATMRTPGHAGDRDRPVRPLRPGLGAVAAMTGCGGSRRWIESNHSSAPPP